MLAIISVSGMDTHAPTDLLLSELAPHRVGKTSDIVKVGDEVKVKCMGFDDRGKVRLSMKVVDQATGQEIAPQKAPAAPMPDTGAAG